MPKFSLVLLTILFASSLSTQAQQTKALTPRDQSVLLTMQIRNAEIEAQMFNLDPEHNREKAGASERLAALYRKAAALPDVSDILTSEIWLNFTTNKIS